MNKHMGTEGDIPIYKTKVPMGDTLEDYQRAYEEERPRAEEQVARQIGGRKPRRH